MRLEDYALIGDTQTAALVGIDGLFEKLADLANDVGLLAEEYDPVAGRLVGNFPQAFSHVSLVNSARNQSARAGGPAEDRQQEGSRGSVSSR